MGMMLSMHVDLHHHHCKLIIVKLSNWYVASFPGFSSNLGLRVLWNTLTLFPGLSSSLGLRLLWNTLTLFPGLSSSLGLRLLWNTLTLFPGLSSSLGLRLLWNTLTSFPGLPLLYLLFLKRSGGRIEVMEYPTSFSKQ